MGSFDPESSFILDLQDGDANLPKSFPALCLETRLWERKHIPFASPQIALDIALYATAARLENQLIASKTVHLTVGYSPDRVREVLADLVEAGWILKIRHQSDGRIRLIEASDKLVALMHEYESMKRRCFANLLSQFRQSAGADPAAAESSP